jgi:hypothetical protein
MRHRFTSLLLLAVALCGYAFAADDEDHVALAKEAERSMHRAVDAWAAAKAEGKPTTQPAADIQKSYFAFMKHVLKTHYIPNAAVIVPGDIASAGLLKEGDREMSYFAGGGQSGVVLSVFHRTEWTEDRVPGHGFLCYLGIEPQELKKSFKVTSGEWADEKKVVLRLHYVLDGKPGVIEARRGEKAWAMYPDRGLMKPGDWWDPYAEIPATRPAE